MATDLKTKKTGKNVRTFLASIEHETRRKDCLVLLELMEEVTGKKPKMWGDSIVGFGEYHYKYASGREGDWMVTGFSPRKQNLVIYIMAGFSNYAEIMDNLGKYKTGKSCLYVKKLDDIDTKQLKKLVSRSYRFMLRTYSCK